MTEETFRRRKVVGRQWSRRKRGEGTFQEIRPFSTIRKILTKNSNKQTKMSREKTTE